MKNTQLYNQIKYGKRRLLKLTDIIFISALIIIIVFSYLFTTQSGGAYAEIYGEGKLVKVMPLNIDDVYLYEYGGQYNYIIVKNGKIGVSEASCNDKICMHYPSTDIAGSVIICLPHKLVILIKGDGGVDGVVG